MAHSVELKQKALTYLGKCKNVSQVATAFGISRNTLYCWIKKQQEGDLRHKSGGNRPIKLGREQLRLYVAEHSEAYLREIAQHFNCHPSTVFYALKSMNITLKKRPAPIKNKTPSKSGNT